MKSGKMPSISEVESIYNFIKAGATGFLLAGETSIGKAPVKTVEFLNKLITNIKIKLEKHLIKKHRYNYRIFALIMNTSQCALVH